MPKIKTGDIDTYYEIYGEGYPIVFIHGGWANNEMWKPQIEYFSKNYKVIVYDVRGHGNTGESPIKKYSIELFSDDLKKLIDELKLDKPIICGLSMGGMIAQVYAVKYNDSLKGLILSDTAISTTLTISDKIVRYILAPKWLFLFFVRIMGMKQYANFAFWAAKKSKGKDWVKNTEFIEYEKNLMTQFTVKEFNKIFAALYDYKLWDLTKIKVPTIILNGEFETKAVFKHTEKALEMIPDSYEVKIDDAGHASNYENSELFNKSVEEFLNNISH